MRRCARWRHHLCRQNVQLYSFGVVFNCAGLVASDVRSGFNDGWGAAMHVLATLPHPPGGSPALNPSLGLASEHLNPVPSSQP